MKQNAGYRLLLALALSTALHLSLIYGVAVGPDALQARPTLVARLMFAEPARDGSRSLPNARDAPSRPQTAPVTASDDAPLEQSPVPEPGDSSAAVALAGEAPSRPEETTLPRADVPLLSDPAWYTSKDLDVFPRALTPLDLAYPATASGEAGEVSVLAMIDEWGSVIDVTVVKAEPAGQFEEPGLRAVKAARFSPAQREGRAVRSQIVVKLRFGPPVQASAGP